MYSDESEIDFALNDFQKSRGRVDLMDDTIAKSGYPLLVVTPTDPNKRPSSPGMRA